MKVLFLAHSGRLQGAGVALLNMLQELIKHDISPTVIIPTSGDVVSALEKINVPYRIIPYYNAVYPNLTKSIKSIMCYVPKLLRTLYYNKLAEIKLLTY